MKKTFAFALFIFLTVIVNAQNGAADDMMKKDGKIYVVVAVMLTILAGFFLYLYRLDRKISKLEKNN